MYSSFLRIYTVRSVMLQSLQKMFLFLSEIEGLLKTPVTVWK